MIADERRAAADPGGHTGATLQSSALAPPRPPASTRPYTLHFDYPGERLIACRNPALAALRAHKRAALLVATETELAKISAAVTAGRLVDAAAIGTRFGKIIGRYKMGKHFTVHIAERRRCQTR